MTTILPDPEVIVTPATDRDLSAPTGSVDVIVSRGGHCISHRTGGGSVAENVRDAVKSIISNPKVGEYIKK